jgi:hypothetical protein
MGLRNFIRESWAKKLIRDYQYAKREYDEWKMRYYAENEKDREKKEEFLIALQADMLDCVLDLNLILNYPPGIWHKVGKYEFYIHTSYEDAKNAIDVK